VERSLPTASAAEGSGLPVLSGLEQGAELLQPPEQIDYLADEVNNEELSNQEHWLRPPSQRT
jgi:hypothetical protein